MINIYTLYRVTVFFNATLAFLIIAGCLSLNKRSDIQVIKITSDAMEYIPPDGNPLNIRSELKIAYYQQYRIYVYFTINEYSKAVLDDEGNEIDEIVYKTDSTYNYVVTKSGNRYGLKYDSLKAGKGKLEKIEIDSMLAYRGITPTNYRIYNHPIIGNPVEVVKNDAGKVTLEKFVVPKTADRHPDSVYRYYDDNLKDIDFSFVPELDKKYDSKAVKLSLVFKPIPKGKLPYDIPRREPYWEMKEIQEKNPQDYLNLIERFKKDSKAMNLNID